MHKKKQVKLAFAKIVSVILSALFLFPSCLDEVDLVPPDSREDSHLILASLSKGDATTVQVEIRTLFGFDGFNSTVPVPTATEVYLLNESGQRIQVPLQDRGFYRLEIPEISTDFNIAVGQKYRLEVQLVDGRILESDLDELQALPPTDSLFIKIGQREFLNAAGEFVTEDAIELLTTVSAQLPGSNRAARYKWNLIESLQFTEQNSGPGDSTTCYITRPLANDRIGIFDGATVTAGTDIVLPLYEGARDYRFAEGYYFTVLLGSISSDAYEYWRQTKELVERDNNMFAAVPGSIQTNFTDLSNPDHRLYGYFYTTHLDTLRLYVSPAEADFPEPFCPIPIPPFLDEPYPICFECLNALGSALEKPHFWEE